MVPGDRAIEIVVLAGGICVVEFATGPEDDIQPVIDTSMMQMMRRATVFISIQA